MCIVLAQHAAWSRSLTDGFIAHSWVCQELHGVGPMVSRTITLSLGLPSSPPQSGASVFDDASRRAQWTRNIALDVDETTQQPRGFGNVDPKGVIRSAL